MREEITANLLRKWQIPNKRLNARTNDAKGMIEKIIKKKEKRVRRLIRKNTSKELNKSGYIYCLFNKHNVYNDYNNNTPENKFATNGINNQTGQDIRIFTLNCRSLRARFVEFSNNLQIHNWEIVHLQETWMNGSKSYIKFKGYKQLTTYAKGKRGGGTMTLIREDLKFKRVLTLNEEENLECIFVELKGKGNPNILLGNVYAHPRGNTRAMIRLGNIH